MPHANPDFITGSEVLLPGEHLSAGLGRFRLFHEYDGRLVAYAYTPDRGVERYWDSPMAGAGAVLKLDRVGVGQRSWPAAVLKRADGSDAFIAGNGRFGAPVWKNHIFVIQNDGNIVHYTIAETTGVVAASWAPPGSIYRRWQQRVSIPPNEPIAEIVGPGTLILATGQGNLGISNSSNQPVAIQQGTNFATLPANQEFSVQTAGTVAIETKSYGLSDLQAPDGTRLSSSSDAHVSIPHPGPGQRPVVDVGPGGRLRLRGLVPGPVPEKEGTTILVSHPFDDGVV